MIQKFVYKRATMEDIDELVRTRIIVLRAANKLPDDEDMFVVEKESYAYYRRALETGEHIAYLVYDNGAFVGAGGVSFYQVMPTYHNPTGKKAYIMNMYAAPEYRRQGIAIIIVLRAANKLPDDEDMFVVEKESYAYYRRALETGEHIAYLVYDNGAFVGAGGVSFYQVMPTYHNPTGKKAYIMNMYAAPEYRRQGIAIHTLDLLVKDAKEQGVLQIALEATYMGRPLYERYGFAKMEDEMELVW